MMPTKPDANLKAIELTQFELDSVIGGGGAQAQAAMAVTIGIAAIAAAAQRRFQQSHSHKSGNSLNRS
jgi:hypothetical protein